MKVLDDAHGNRSRHVSRSREDDIYGDRPTLRETNRHIFCCHLCTQEGIARRGGVKWLEFRTWLFKRIESYVSRCRLSGKGQRERSASPPRAVLEFNCSMINNLCYREENVRTANCFGRPFGKFSAISQTGFRPIFRCLPKSLFFNL
jgi:hypothetical protein